jgi:hypothetical protein
LRLQIREMLPATTKFIVILKPPLAFALSRFSYGSRTRVPRLPTLPIAAAHDP